MQQNAIYILQHTFLWLNFHFCLPLWQETFAVRSGIPRSYKSRGIPVRVSIGLMAESLGGILNPAGNLSLFHGHMPRCDEINCGQRLINIQLTRGHWQNWFRTMRSQVLLKLLLSSLHLFRFWVIPYMVQFTCDDNEKTKNSSRARRFTSARRIQSCWYASANSYCLLYKLWKP